MLLSPLRRVGHLGLVCDGVLGKGKHLGVFEVDHGLPPEAGAGILVEAGAKHGVAVDDGVQRSVEGGRGQHLGQLQDEALVEVVEAVGVGVEVRGRRRQPGRGPRRPGSERAAR